MSDVVKLPRGGALYTQEEIEMACRVIETVRSEKRQADEDADDFEDKELKKIHFLKRFWLRLSCLFSRTNIWRDFYDASMERVESKWGFELVYFADYDSEHDLFEFRRLERDCYLNPAQISVLEFTRERFELIGSSEYPEARIKKGEGEHEGVHRMSDAGKLPRGVTLYDQEDVDMAGRVITTMWDERIQAHNDARDFMDKEWGKIHFLKRFWFQLRDQFGGAGIRRGFYSASMEKVQERWDIDAPYCAGYDAVDELYNLSRSGRNCFLNPDQVHVLERTRKYFDLIGSSEYPEVREE